MSEQHYGDKDEKQEKELEKREEKSPEEKQWDEKYRRDPLSVIVWAAILIWAGLALLAGNLGLWGTGISGPGGAFAGMGTWSIIFIGAGLIILAEAVIRLLVPTYRRPITGTLIFAVILIGIGIGDRIGWGVIWPLILVALGLGIVIGALTRRR